MAAVQARCMGRLQSPQTGIPGMQEAMQAAMHGAREASVAYELAHEQAQGGRQGRRALTAGPLQRRPWTHPEEEEHKSDDALYKAQNGAQAQGWPRAVHHLACRASVHGWDVWDGFRVGDEHPVAHTHRRCTAAGVLLRFHTKLLPAKAQCLQLTILANVGHDGLGASGAGFFPPSAAATPCGKRGGE